MLISVSKGQMEKCCWLQGNLKFCVDGDTPIIENSKVVSVIAELLSTKAELVEKALLFRTVATGRDVIDKQHTEQEATYGRDAFAKVSAVPSCAQLCDTHTHISAAFAHGLRCAAKTGSAQGGHCCQNCTFFSAQSQEDSWVGQ